MISLILPYWDRQAAADNGLRSIAKAYADLSLEIVVVDDGNKVPFKVPDLPLYIRVLRLPEKTLPMSPARAWNEGVKFSTGDIVVLSCIEILHPNPVIPQMVENLKVLGPMGYVLAAAYCPESKHWHCHSTTAVPDCPPGTGIGFCGALHRELFYSVGGFDEEFMKGAGYEDRDFIRRMVVEGAQFVIRDDLVVIHPKTGATIKWGHERFATNETYYKRKWAC